MSLAQHDVFDPYGRAVRCRLVPLAAVRLDVTHRLIAECCDQDLYPFDDDKPLS